MSHLYDVIFIGESLASRIAAALLARKGKRLLVFRDGTTMQQWLFGSPLLDEVLARLGSRRSAEHATHLQVITTNSRLDLRGPESLAEELEREFPRTHPELSRELSELFALGARLEEKLRNRARQALAGGLARSIRLLNFQSYGGTDSFAKCLADFGEIEQRFLTTLFEGLACAPAENISRTEAALLWRQVMQPLHMSVEELESFLDQRFEQFHGSRAGVDEVREFSRAGRLFEIQTRSGASCRSPFVVFGNSAQRNRFLQTDYASAQYQRLTCQIHGRTSPLLARRVLLSGAPALRLTLENGNDDSSSCRVDMPRRRPLRRQEEKYLLERLGELFPFTSLTLQGELPEPAGGIKRRTRFPAADQPFRQRPSMTYLCQGAALWPVLGSTGEVLAGLATADLLAGKLN